ncbi:PREDICTED: peroxisomal N(1)-acetyl-spermine/spermidine oxidase-like, partial [Wasmannia auropunctata]|uniref:peroxisomal N(1)-acetyl-spermine/spermidine oxidase-like n=1 Tax=Wasmannia auropunctata TaxID=64793 RepID=UPI0005F04C72
METLSDDDVFDGLYLLLQKSFGSHYNVVKPTKMLRSKWYTNEHSRGSYSFQSLLSEEMDVRPKDLAEPILTENKPVILFAGEATHDHYYSTVHGAVETGFREADRLIDFE